MLMVLFFALTLAQTQPPNAPAPSGTGTLICHYDANDGQVHPDRVQPDQAPVDRGIATEGHDTLASSAGCAVDALPTPPKMTTGEATATSTPTAAPISHEPLPTATEAPTAPPTPEVVSAQATSTPTVVPERPTPGVVPEATSVPTVEMTPEPEPQPAPLPACTPGGVVPCGGK